MDTANSRSEDLEVAGFIGRCEPYSGRRDPRRSVGGESHGEAKVASSSPRSGFRPVGGRARHRALRAVSMAARRQPRLLDRMADLPIMLLSADRPVGTLPAFRRSRVVSIPPGALVSFPRAVVVGNFELFAQYDWTGLRQQPFPEVRQASAINEAMSSSGRRLKSFANSPMILPLRSRWKCLRISPRVLESETRTRC